MPEPSRKTPPAAPSAPAGLPPLEEVLALRSAVDAQHQRMLAHVRALQEAMDERMRLLRELFVAGTQAAIENARTAGAYAGTASAPTSADVSREDAKAPSESGATPSRGGRNAKQPDGPPPPRPADSDRVHEPTDYTRREVPLQRFVRNLARGVEGANAWSFASHAKPDIMSAMRATESRPGHAPLVPPVSGIPVTTFLASLGIHATMHTSFEISAYSDGRPVLSPIKNSDGRLEVPGVPFPGGTPYAFVMTKRGRVHVIKENVWIPPGVLVPLTHQAPLGTVQEIGLAICSICVCATRGSKAARAVGLQGAYLPANIVMGFYSLVHDVPCTLAPPDHPWLWRTQVEMTAAHLCNTLALEWKMPVLFIDAEVSFDRRMVITTYICHVWFDASAFAAHVETTLGLARLIMLPAPGSFDLGKPPSAAAKAVEKATGNTPPRQNAQ